MGQPLWQFIGKTFPDVNIYTLVKALVYIVIMLVAGRLIFWFADFSLKRILVKRKHPTFILEERRAKTLYPLLRSILFYTVSFLVVINILPVVGVKTTTLLAGVSALGLALGFGAQSLVKDVISGFFIIFEDQFAVGEYVRTNEYEGTVEEIGLRSTKLRSPGGELHILPNGTITSVTNFNRGKMRALVDINLSYDTNIEQAMEVISRVGRELAEEYQDIILEGPEVQGIINFGDAFVVVRTIAYTVPMKQWEIERELRKRIIKALEQAGIRISSLRKVYIEAKNRE